MKRVLLDVDGVLRNFVKGAIEVVNTLPNRQHDVEDVTSWDIAAALDRSPEERKAMCAGINVPGFAARLDAYPGSAEFVRHLTMAHDVFFVTSPWNSNPTWASDTETWLHDRYLVPHGRVLHVPSGAKRLVRGDVLVDDKVSTVREWQDEGLRWGRSGRTAGVLWRNHHNVDEAWMGFSSSDYDLLVDFIARMP